MFNLTNSVSVIDADGDLYACMGRKEYDDENTLYLVQAHSAKAVEAHVRAEIEAEFDEDDEDSRVIYIDDITLVATREK